MDAVAEESGTRFEGIDLVTDNGEWYEYDEKESREVSISGISFKIIVVK